MVVDLFDPINKPKSNYEEILVDKTCMACFKPYKGQLWSKRCAECKAINAPFRRQLTEGKQTFTGRTYKSPVTGKSYPSVTSIINLDPIEFPPELLKQYGSRGSIVHKMIEEYLGTKKIIDPLTTPELARDVETVTKGSLNLKWTDCNFVGFLEKHGADFTFEQLEQFLFNDQYEYAGRTDCFGSYKGEPAIVDWKTASSYPEDKLHKFFAQLAAYANATNKPVKYLVIVPLNPKTGFDEPIVSSMIEKNFNNFLDYRAKFREVYGI